MNMCSTWGLRCDLQPGLRRGGPMPARPERLAAGGVGRQLAFDCNQAHIIGC
jgi:hypothetical protein